MNDEYDKMKPATRKERREWWDKKTKLVDSMILIKKRYLSRNLVKKILMLDVISDDEMIGESYISEGTWDLTDIDDSSRLNFEIELVDELFEKLQGKSKKPKIVKINPKWIKKAIFAHYKLFEDPKYWEGKQP